MSFIIKRNTIIPCEVSKSYVTGEDNQDKFMIDIYEGKREFIKDNFLLDKFYIKTFEKLLKEKLVWILFCLLMKILFWKLGLLKKKWKKF